jgi:hypothetical protein
MGYAALDAGTPMGGDTWDVPSRGLLPTHCSACGTPFPEPPACDWDGRCAHCKVSLLKGQVPASVFPLRNAIRRHLARALSTLPRSRVLSRHTLGGAAFAAHAVPIWGRRTLGKAWHLAGQRGGRMRKEVVKMRCTSELELENLLSLEGVTGVKGGMGPGRAPARGHARCMHPHRHDVGAAGHVH